MIEIIKDNSESFDMICWHCDSHFKYHFEDLDKRSPFVTGHIEAVICPCCGALCDHSDRVKGE